MNYSVRSNCVSTVHCAFEVGIHPNSTLQTVTNGVYQKRWQASAWDNKAIESLSDEDIWKIHQQNKEAMFNRFALPLDPDKLTIVWARRLVTYKRPMLLFSDLDRLAELVNHEHHPIQLIFAGNPGQTDSFGQQTAKELMEITRLPEFNEKVVFIHDYSLSLAQFLSRGADVWLNTPKVGYEACGTSGMKAGLNGALEMSTSDGWVAENNWQGVGWIIPEEDIENQLYSLIEKETAPLYYEHDDHLPTAWIKRMRETMKLCREKYSAERMLKDYEEKMYFP